jgi:hypothetical protein
MAALLLRQASYWGMLSHKLATTTSTPPSSVTPGTGVTCRKKHVERTSSRCNEPDQSCWQVQGELLVAGN